VLKCKLIGLKDASNYAYLDINSGQNCIVRVSNKSFENVTQIFGKTITNGNGVQKRVKSGSYSRIVCFLSV